MKLGIFETVISGCMRSCDLDYPANDCDLSKWARFIAMDDFPHGIPAICDFGNKRPPICNGGLFASITADGIRKTQRPFLLEP